MKTSRRQLKEITCKVLGLVNEAFTPTLAGDAALRVGQRSSAMDPNTVRHITDVGKEDPYQAYELATMLGSEEQPPIENLDIDLPLEAILVSGKPALLETLGFTNLFQSISFDANDRIVSRLAPERLAIAKYKASVLNKPIEDLMEIRYSWWEGGYYMAIEEWIQNNPDLYTAKVMENPYPNEEHTLYDVKGVKMLHISSADNDSTYTI